MSHFARRIRHPFQRKYPNAVLKFVRYLALFAVTASLCLACQSDAPSITLTEPLIVGNSPWPGFIAQFIAEEKGFYQEEGIRIEEKHFPVSTDADSALIADKLDLAWTGISDLIKLANEDPSFRLIAVSDYSDGADGIVASGVSSPKDLLGKTIAWEDQPLQALLLKAYLKGTGIDIQDLNLLLLPPDEAADAFVSGRVDAAITFEPYLTSATADGRGKVIFSSKDTNLIAGGLIGKKSTLTSHRKDIEAYLRALEAGLSFYESNPKEALEIAAAKLKLPVEELGPIMNNVRLFSPTEHASVVFNAQDPLNIMDSIDFATEVSTDLGIVKPAVDASTLYDDSYVKDI